jgi:hypothetical protein
MTPSEDRLARARSKNSMPVVFSLMSWRPEADSSECS